MTYRNYIMKNHIKDSKEAYVEYLEKHHAIYRMMNPKMKEQHVARQFKFRFV